MADRVLNTSRFRSASSNVNRRGFLAYAGAALASGLGVVAGEAKPEAVPLGGTGTTWSLPAPRRRGGRPLMEVLWDRASGREFVEREPTAQVISELLWAAFGINRPGTGHRTAPSAMNSQETEIYVMLSSGAWHWEPQGHRLHELSREDWRGTTGGQDYVRVAPLSLVYVADLRRLERAAEAERRRYALMDVGFVAQNVYLYCASEGLASVVHMVPEGADLGKALALGEGQEVLLAQCVGYPKATSRKG